jgi:hypothetical protein
VVIELDQLLMEFGLKDGIFVGLFVWLLIYVLNTSKERESRLLTFLDGMKEEFAKLVGSYESLSKDVNEMKDEFSEFKENRK